MYSVFDHVLCLALYTLSGIIYVLCLVSYTWSGIIYSVCYHILSLPSYTQSGIIYSVWHHILSLQSYEECFRCYLHFIVCWFIYPEDLWTATKIFSQLIWSTDKIDSVLALYDAYLDANLRNYLDRSLRSNPEKVKPRYWKIHQATDGEAIFQSWIFSLQQNIKFNDARNKCSKYFHASMREHYVYNIITMFKVRSLHSKI